MKEAINTNAGAKIAKSVHFVSTLKAKEKMFSWSRGLGEKRKDPASRLQQGRSR
jgi:hypothetical protein